MSLGLGIFLSIALLIVVWQIDKRGAFRKVGAWLGIGVILLIAAIAGVGWRNDRVSKQNELREKREARAAIHNGTRQHYEGLALGMSEQEVLYVKGEPTSREDVDGKKVPAQWIWEEAHSGRVHIVAWDAEKKVRAIVCFSESIGACQKVAGVEDGDSEGELLAALGAPPKAPTFSEDGRKVFVYGPNTASRWRFTLEKQQVRAIALVGPRKDDSD